MNIPKAIPTTENIIHDAPTLENIRSVEYQWITSLNTENLDTKFGNDLISSKHAATKVNDNTDILITLLFPS